jgi:hypothetical protein
MQQSIGLTWPCPEYPGPPVGRVYLMPYSSDNAAIIYVIILVLLLDTSYFTHVNSLNVPRFPFH